jgi:NAD(P)-dependent dehydrogenase (short-subunit alcohol dehydrogenase family)
VAGRFEGKVAVITGAASGLGEAGARLLVAEGGKVVLADYSAERGEKVAAELGANAVFVKCDVTKEADIAKAFDAAVSTWGRCDGAWANAGIVGLAGPIAEADMDQFDQTMAVLARGVFCTFKHAARVMVPLGNGGCLIGTASVAAVKGGMGPHAYAMAKAGVVGLCRNMASELAPFRIRANSIAPGSIPTGMTAHVITGNPDDLEAAAARMAAMSPIGRAPHANDIAETMLFLMSDAGSYISGQCIVVDAGDTATVRANPQWAGSRMVVARGGD